MASVTYTAEQYAAFKTGVEVIQDLRSKGIRNPKTSTQTANADNSITFEEE